MALGASDTTHPLALHMLGMHGTASANYAVEDCDFLIATGARFDDRVAGNPGQFAPRAKNIAHFDVDFAEIGKVKRVNWHHVGMLERDLNDLLAYGRRIGFSKNFSTWHEEIAQLKSEYAMNYDRSSELIQPYAVIEEINKLTKGEAIISTRCGLRSILISASRASGLPREAWARWALACQLLLVRSLRVLTALLST
jgi:acetolactate synthase-1/2/3 large subunit